MRNQLLLAAIAGLMFFTHLGDVHLWDVDEAIFTQAAKEMYVRGEHVVPYFNGAVFPDKPAMMYWLMTSAFDLFGPTEFAARFWSAVFGILSVLLTYHLGRLMFSPAVGFWSGLILASSVNYNVIARAATPDAFLVFFSTLAVFFFVSGTAKARANSGEPNERNAPWAGQTTFRPSWATYARTYAAMALGVLTKGPVGVVLPTAVIGLFLLVMRAKPIVPAERSGWRSALVNCFRFLCSILSPKLFLQTVWSMRPLTAVAMVLAVAGPWYVLVGMETGGDWLKGFFGVHNFGRFLNAMDNHRGPIVYYVVAISIGFFPWSVLFAPSWLHMKQALAASQPWRPGYVLLCSWVAVWVGFFSLAGTKLPSYVLPAYPALALFTGCFVESWLREPDTISRAWMRMAWGTVALAGVAIAVALPIVAHIYLDGGWWLGLIGLIPLAGAAVGIVYSERGESRSAVVTLSVMSVVLAIAIFGYGAVYVDQFQNSHRFAQIIESATPTGEERAIGSFAYFRPSLVFYTERSIPEIPTGEAVQAFFAAHPGNTFLITTDKQYENLSSALPADVRVLDTRRRFLQSGNVLLLGRTASPEATAARPDEPGETSVH